MLKKLIISVLLAVLVFNIFVLAADLLSSAQISNNGSMKYKAVRLTPQIYNNANENLTDIRLYDNDNKAVAYFVNSFTESNSEMKKSYALKQTDSFTVNDTNNTIAKNNYYCIDYALSVPQENDILATSIEVMTNNTGFAKNVELLGSYDGIAWETVQNDMLYDVDGNKKLEILFPEIKKYTHYRFKIYNNLEKVTFGSVKLNYNNIVKKKESFASTLYPQYSVETIDKTTVVKLDGMKNLKVESIIIDTDSMFKRKVSFEGEVSKELYNLSFKNIQYKDTTLPLDFKIKTDTAELIIQNGDDKPIKINRIEVKYLVDELVFEGTESGSFTIIFGNTENIAPPEYDIANYKDEIINQGYDILDISEIKTQAPNKSETNYDFKWLFNVVIIIVSLVMGILIFLKVKKI